jgi:hypothetical protein
MQIAERPETAVTAEPGLSVTVEGEELKTVLALLEMSRRRDPKVAERLRRAKELALFVRRTGHLPAQLPA